MSDKQYVLFLSGWKAKDGFISVKADPKRTGVKVWAEDVNSGRKIAIESFFLKPNNKDAPDANPNWPDYQGTFVIGEKE